MMMFLTIWMLSLSLCHGWFFTDISGPHNMDVQYGETAVLPCHSSAPVDEDAEVTWEVWGTELASVTRAGRTIADPYKTRVRFASDLPGNFSLVIDSVMLSDSSQFECLQDSGKILSVSWLKVQPPQVESVVEVFPYTTSVTLPCYLHLPRNLDLDQLNVWWEKDEKILLERVNGEVTIHGEGWTNPQDQDLIQNYDRFPYFLEQPSGSGEYSCWYRTKQSKEAKRGIPGTIKVIYTDFLFDSEYENYTENSTEESGSTFFGITLFELDTEEMPTSEMPIFVDTVTAAMDVSSSTETLPMEAHEETYTSFPHEDVDEEDDEEEEDSVDWSDFPWVRIGLIAAVLSATALVLCILGLLHKL